LPLYGKMDDKMTYINRTLENSIPEVNRQFPVLYLSGIRQCGKTTLLKHLAGNERRYVTLDDPLLLSLAKTDPALFLQRFKPPVLIDEVQYAPELFPYIKMEADQKGENGLFWLTGSQHFPLIENIQESLAGRVAILNLSGLSYSEISGYGPSQKAFFPATENKIEKATDIHALFQTIWRGSFPKLCAFPETDWQLFYQSYVQTYLLRDIRQLNKPGDESAFLRFMQICAARSSQMLVVSDLARDADLPVNTAKRWLSLLESSGLIWLLKPWQSNLSPRLVKAPKLYFLDSGLAAWLTGWNSPETLLNGAFAGPIFESWTVSELLKSYWHNGRQAPFYYYRNKDKREIDLLIHQDGKLYPVEIKMSASPKVADIRHFSVLDKWNAEDVPGTLICLVQQSIPLSRTVNALPVSAI
jgi:uncharacterized protein